MADNNEVKFLLDLDISHFTENALTAQGAIKSIGDSENVSGLLETLGEASLVIGTAAIAAYAFKEAIDLTKEAETIQRTQQEFETLTASAGLSAKALTEGLEQASHGLISTNDLLASANQAIIKMGGSAAKLPEIMEVARKATAVFGGDLQANFSNITTAIGNGNARMLKHYGIVVDTTKAVKDFANANGIAQNEVSEAGRRQAIMNAALDQAQERFKGVSGDLGQTTTLMQQLSVTASELKEMFILVFDKTVGPSLHNFLNVVNDVASKAKIAMTAMFGEGMEQNTAAITQAEAKLNSLKGALIDLQQQKGEGSLLDKMFKGSKENQIQQLNQQILTTATLLDTLKSKGEQLEAQDQKSEQTKQQLLNTGKRAASDDIVNQASRMANDAKFKTELAASDKAYYAEKQKNINSIGDLEKIVQNSTLALAQDHAAKLATISRTESLNAQQKTRLEISENNRYAEAVKANERAMIQLRLSLMNQYLQNSKSVYQGIERAAQQMTLQAKAELQDFGMQGKEIMSSFKQNSVNAFQTMGAAMAQGTDIAQATTDAIKSLFLGMIGDIAIQDGTRIMLSGVWPPNPIALAGGAALIAFGGALKSLSGGSSTTTSTGAASTSPTTVSATNGGTTTTTAGNSGNVSSPNSLSSMQSVPQRVVSVNIAGNYFDTSTTRLQLMNMIRQETNATSFEYNTIGV